MSEDRPRVRDGIISLSIVRVRVCIGVLSIGLGLG